MRGKRAVSGLLAASVMVISAVMVPMALAEPPPLKESGHTTWVFCHRTGSESNPYVVIATDDAAWAMAHVHGSDPAHPVLDGRDDVYIGIVGVDIFDKKQADDICDGKNPPPPPPPK